MCKTIIEEFWVINETGLCLFYRSIHPGKESPVENQSDLVSGMFSAILQFHSQLSGSNIQKFEDTEGKFLFFARRKLIFIVKAKLNAPDDKIKKRVNLIQEQFIKKFSAKLDAFDGNVTEFKKYEKELDLLFIEMSKAEKWGRELEGLKL